jgi:FkbM family methyltransferase
MQLARRIAAKALIHSGLCERFIIQREGYCVRFHPSSFSAGLWVNPSWVSSDEQFLRRYLNCNDVFVDVGANIGTLSLTASTVCARVVAIEAHPRTYKFLCDNLNLNNAGNVVAVHTAVGEESGSVHFSSLTDDDKNHISAGGIEVPIVTLDSMELPGIDLLKIDVEGYELQVFQGAEASLLRTKCVYFESFNENCKRFNYHPRDVFALLIRAGFKVFKPSGESVDPSSDSPVCRNLVALRDLSRLTDLGRCEG